MIQIILTIALIDFLSILTPGSDFAIVTRNTLKYSRTKGYWSALGVGAVTLTHCFSAMLGLSLLVTAHPNLMAFIKTLGALYLIYLGTSFVKKAQNLEIKITANQTASSISNWQAFKQGAITNILNLEPMMAFISVFAIILPADTSLLVKVIIGLLLPLNTVLWLMFMAKVFSISTVKIFLETRMKMIETSIGVILIFFGTKTLTHK